jgi:arylsulfatase A-like enzyme
VLDEKRLFGGHGVRAVYPAWPLTVMTKPNIIVWAPDDFGMDAWALYMDRYSLPAYDSTLGNIPTPNLDALVQRGVKFTRAYSQPFCSPTRAQWMTGRYGFKTGIGALVDTNDQALLDLEVGLARGLKEATSYAYKCGVFGKWHLSNYSSMGGIASHPITVGFDEFYGTQGNVDFQGYYFFEGWHSKKTANGISISMERVDRYLPEWTIEKALEWINRQTQPWFAYMPVNLPHGPLHRPPADLYDTTRYVLPEDGINTNPTQLTARTFYSAMVQSMDTLFGRFLDGIPQETLANTVIIVWSDNGTGDEQVGGNLNPAKGKYSAYDLGINVPMVVAGPGVSTPGRTSSVLISPSDLFATIVDIGQGNIALVSNPPNHGTGDFTGTRNTISFWGACQSPTYSGLRTSLLADKFAYNIPHLNATQIGLRAVVTLYSGKYYKLIRFNGTGTTFTGMTEGPAGVWTPNVRTDADAFYDLEADPREDVNYLRITSPLTLTTTQKLAYDQAKAQFGSLQSTY